MSLQDQKEKAQRKLKEWRERRAKARKDRKEARKKIHDARKERKRLIKLRKELRRRYDALGPNADEQKAHKIKAQLVEIEKKLHELHKDIGKWTARVHDLADKAKEAGRHARWYAQVRLPHIQKRIKKAHEHATQTNGWNPMGSRIVTYDGKQVTEWIAYRNVISRAAGWAGYMISGFRTPEYSESLCYGICHQPTCPGTCAGRASHHSGYIYPQGANDVSDYYNYGSLQRALDSRVPGVILWNSLPYDRPHYSATGN
jgi:hypothetical protein